VTGYLSFDGMLAFLGGKSRAWGRAHISEIPHYRLHDRLLFRPEDLVVYVEKTAVRVDPIDIDSIVASVVGQRKRRVAG
jgi:hypothetical protein